MVFTIKNIWNWLDKFQDIVFKSTKASDISNDIVKIVLLDNSSGKKEFSKVTFCFEKRYVFNISSGVRGFF